MDWQQQLKYRYATATMLEKLIAINVVMLILMYLSRTIGFLMQINTDFFVEWLVFPKEIGEFIIKPWTIITYAFMHSGFFHILFNMIILYFSGQIFLTFFSPKRLLNYYILGAISGALIYMLSYNLFPAFSSVGESYLIGASASVMAVLVGIATQVPNYSVRLILIGNVKLWWIAVFFVGLDVAQIPLGNAGGHLAHIGGALIGYTYTQQLTKGNDIGRFVTTSFDYLSDLMSSKSKPKMKTVYKNKAKKAKSNAKKKSSTSTVNRTEKQKRVDEILDKISKSGYDSLTKEEKDFLFDAGKDI
jgi:membrane associated rhomboid family serine protease